MIDHITNPEDVRIFAKQLTKEGTIFHPDDNFIYTVNNKTGLPAYSLKEAKSRNELMIQCFSVCNENGIDIYDTMCEVVLIETGLDKLIPVPSQF